MPNLKRAASPASDASNKKRTKATHSQGSGLKSRAANRENGEVDQITNLSMSSFNNSNLNAAASSSSGGNLMGLLSTLGTNLMSLTPLKPGKSKEEVTPLNHKLSESDVSNQNQNPYPKYPPNSIRGAAAAAKNKSGIKTPLLLSSPSGSPPGSEKSITLTAQKRRRLLARERENALTTRHLIQHLRKEGTREKLRKELEGLRRLWWGREELVERLQSWWLMDVDLQDTLNSRNVVSDSSEISETAIIQDSSLWAHQAAPSTPLFIESAQQQGITGVLRDFCSRLIRNPEIFGGSREISNVVYLEDLTRQNAGQFRGGLLEEVRKSASLSIVRGSSCQGGWTNAMIPNLSWTDKLGQALWRIHARTGVAFDQRQGTKDIVPLSTRLAICPPKFGKSELRLLLGNILSQAKSIREWNARQTSIMATATSNQGQKFDLVVSHLDVPITIVLDRIPETDPIWTEILPMLFTEFCLILRFVAVVDWVDMGSSRPTNTFSACAIRYRLPLYTNTQLAELIRRELAPLNCKLAKTFSRNVVDNHISEEDRTSLTTLVFRAKQAFRCALHHKLNESEFGTVTSKFFNGKSCMGQAGVDALGLQNPTTDNAMHTQTSFGGPTIRNAAFLVSHFPHPAVCYALLAGAMAALNPPESDRLLLFGSNAGRHSAKTAKFPNRGIQLGGTLIGRIRDSISTRQPTWASFSRVRALYDALRRLNLQSNSSSSTSNIMSNISPEYFGGGAEFDQIANVLIRGLGAWSVRQTVSKIGRIVDRFSNQPMNLFLESNQWRASAAKQTTSNYNDFNNSNNNSKEGSVDLVYPSWGGVEVLSRVGLDQIREAARRVGIEEFEREYILRQPGGF